MKKYGLVGKSLSHSFSHSFFKDFFNKNKIDADYSNYELNQISDFKELLKNHSFDGLNVTIPYKETIIPLVDSLTEEAKAIGAVNVISFKDGKLIGHNTDAYGFKQSIKPFLTFHHERALIIGTGGAAKSVNHVLRNIGIDTFFLSRNPKLINEFSYDEVNENMIKSCKLIVNCTPVGTFPNIKDCIQIPFNSLSSEHLVVDLIYNPEETEFLIQSKLAGATTLNGLSMLKNQALKSWEIWNEE